MLFTIGLFIFGNNHEIILMVAESKGYTNGTNSTLPITEISDFRVCRCLSSNPDFHPDCPPYCASDLMSKFSPLGDSLIVAFTLYFCV